MTKMERPSRGRSGAAKGKTFDSRDYAIDDPIEQFRAALSGRVIVPDEIIPDGVLHRCDVEGKRGKGDAAYLLHLDGIPAGGFENWRDGLGWQNWRADIGRILTPDEEAAHKAITEAARRAREADDTKRKSEAREACAHTWNKAKPASKDHPYLALKGVESYGLKVTGNGQLLIPLRDAAGTLHSLQFIGTDGTKRFKTGGRKHGCYFSIGKPDGVLCICEGYATGASIHEATGHAVAVAFDAGNLLPIAKALRAKLPDVKIIVCADDDWKTEGNPGLTKAKEAARVVGGLLAVPDFGTDRPDRVSDFNDMAALCGSEAVSACIAAAQAAVRGNPSPVPENAPTGEYARTVELIRASDISPEPISWLWNGWLAAGKMHILGGAPGTGKTTISMALAATVTTGGRWPDGTRSMSGNVVIWSGEDDPADTLVPRLILSGADPKRVRFIKGVLEGNEKRSFDPATDMEPLRRALVEIGGVKLLVVDPIVSAITGDSHKNAEVRRGLQPLVDLASELDCALLGITHFSKGTGGRDPTERITGSLAFGALARIVMVAAKHQDSSDNGKASRILCRAKSNIGPDEGGFEYDLQQDELRTHPGIFSSCVLWGDAIEGTARELLAAADATGDDGEGSTLSEAENYLLELLSGGELSSKKIKSDAKDAGFSWRTIRRAQENIGIKPRREGFGKNGFWVWKLSDSHRCPSGKKTDLGQDTLDIYVDASDTNGFSEFSDAKNTIDVQTPCVDNYDEKQAKNGQKPVIVEVEI
ncbi:hypothetical protein FACS189475_08270 [Betaproteobacteria bacterium]|nr:hypothetical protein FACS189475_08270 [Betaproteobacteria bacterium]